MKMFNKIIPTLVLSLLSVNSFASDIVDNTTDYTNLFIGGFIGATILLAIFAFIKTKSANDYYAAGNNVSGFSNGLALAGDYLSAASFLAISSMVFTNGFDGLIFSIGWLVGWPVLTFIIGERIKNLSSSTWGDALDYRFKQRSVRIFVAASSVIVVLLYIVAQMVGAGKLMNSFFGMDKTYAMMLIGGLTFLYVALGGMKATTWIQILKAVMLIGSVTFMALMVLNYINWDPTVLFEKSIQLHTMQDSIMVPGGYIKDPVSAISIGLALMFGTAGLPHILQRLVTVKDSTEARKSLVWATNWIGYFYFLTFIIGFGAIVFLNQHPEIYFKGGEIKNGLLNGNGLVAVELAKATGGSVFGQFVITVAFATIIAVVTGLTLAATSALSHDLFVKKEKTESTKNTLLRARLSAAVVAILGVALSIYLQTLDTGFMVTLAFAVASSSIVPCLIMSIMWKDSTTKGIVAGGWAGLSSSVLLTILSPSIWVNVFHFSPKTVIFPFASPTMFTMTLAFLIIWVVSLWDNSEQSELERKAYEEQELVADFGPNEIKKIEQN